MTEKITQQQLNQIVAAVDKLSQQKETELSRQQVEDILLQLNLSPEFLDEAMIQLQRQNALAIQKRRNILISLGLITALIIGVSTTIYILQKSQQKLGSISVYQSRLTLVEDNGGNLEVINRQNNPEVYYRVTLQKAPLGEKLSLQCNWVDPTGQIAHQNNYQTRQINTAVWTTYCRHQLGMASPAGTWKVQIYLGNRILSEKSFILR